MAFLFLASCGGHPYEYTDSTEIKPGPGLFSGPLGEFQLIKAETGGAQDNEIEESSAAPPLMAE